jgi:hypothetical protein
MLSRLLITGTIDFNTPLCIISEIADAHGINYDINNFNNNQYIQDLIDTINSEEIITINLPIIAINDWEYLARFINKSVSWSQNLLIDAYEFLSSFIKNDIDKIPKNFITGIQTPENIYSINPCVLYKICKIFDICMTSKTTINQMSQAVYYIKCDKSLLVNKCILSVHKFNKSSLINLLINNNNDKINETDYNNVPDQLVTYDDLVKLENKTSNITELLHMVEPKSNGGAIILAAVNYYIDISKSNSPIDEYIELRHNGLNYNPTDKWFKYWFEKNRDLFDLKKTFNPLFPRKIYNQNLFNLAKSYGYNINDKNHISNPYEFLQLEYTSETFYQGLLPLTKKVTTIIDLDKLSEVPYGQLLSYGQIDISLNPITISELIDLFTANQNFTSPFGPDKVFSRTSIKKLQNILLYPHETDYHIKIDISTLSIRKKLSDLITEIELTNDDKSRLLVSIYKNGNYSTKNHIENLLKILLVLGMNMRGWLGVGDYPIREAPVPYNKEIEVALNVTQSIAKYKEECNKNKKLGNIIDDLPLVKYRDGEYLVSKNKDDGFTISERIEIVKKGIDNPTIYSCIRMSSNFICSSVHKYSLILGLPAPFDIFKLRHIS